MSPSLPDTLARALDDLDAAVGRYVALAHADPAAVDAYDAAVEAARRACDAAARKADLILAAIIAAGGARGTLAVIGAACERAFAAYDALSATPGPARAVASHAYGAAVARWLQAHEALVLPWLRARAAQLEEAIAP